MNRRVLGAIVLVGLALSLVVPTAAITLQANGGPVDETGDLQLAPSNEPNGQYALIDGQGELALDFSALNAQAVTSADAVFTITSTDSVPREVWIEHELPGVTFYEGYDRTNQPVESDPIRLEPNETATIGITIDTHVAPNGTGPFSVVTRYPDTIELRNVSVEPTIVQPGQNITVTAEYYNTGTAAESTMASLVENGIVVDQRSITVADGATGTVQFERQMSQIGTYNVTVDEYPTTTVQVRGGGPAPLPPPSGGPSEPPQAFPDLVVQNATLETNSTDIGEPVTVNVSVENRGIIAGEMTLELAVDGVVADRQVISVNAGESTTATFTVSFDEPGSYAIAVNGDGLGSIVVHDTFDASVFNREFGPPLLAAVTPPFALGITYLGLAARRRDPA